MSGHMSPEFRSSGLPCPHISSDDQRERSPTVRPSRRTSTTTVSMSHTSPPVRFPDTSCHEVRPPCRVRFHTVVDGGSDDRETRVVSRTVCVHESVANPLFTFTDQMSTPLTPGSSKVLCGSRGGKTRRYRSLRPSHPLFGWGGARRRSQESLFR